MTHIVHTKINDSADTLRILWPEYTESLENLVALLQREDFLHTVAENGIKNLSDDIYKGGMSVVVSSGDNTVLKISSIRRLDNFDENYVFPDITSITLTAEEKLEVALVNAHKKRESYSYTILEDSRKESLSQPFLIPVYKGNFIYDYILCVHLPKYTPLSSRMTSFKEKEILKMVSDVLECLEKADGLRHRDIKPGNIMYDAICGKYVLIDWGASYRLADDEYASEMNYRKTGQPFTQVYADPLRFSENSLDVRTDLYSLGVLMAFMAHSDGYFKNPAISDFHARICPNSVRKLNNVISNGKEIRMTLPVIDTDLVLSQLTTAKELYREICKKALCREYSSIGDMKSEISSIITPKKEKPEKKSLPAIRITPLTGVFFAIFLGVYTFLLSGSKGLVINTPLSVLMLLLCTTSPLFLIFIKNRARSMYVTIPSSTIIVSLAFFFVISLTIHFTLRNLELSCPLALNCALFILSSLMCSFLSNDFGGKIFLKFLVWGIFVGLCTGLSITLCLCGDNLSLAFSPIYISLTLSSLFLGCVSSLWLCFLWFLWHTRLKRT